MLKSANGFFAALLICTACALDSGEPSGGPSRDNADLRERRQEMLDRKAPQRLPPTRETDSITGEVPADLLALVRRDLAQRLGHDRIALRRAAAVIWPSGALGCPQPGEVYTQATVSGYHVVFEADGKTWDYRLNRRGGFRRCDTPGAPTQVLPYPTQ